MAPTLPDLIVNTLRKDDEITDKVGSARLVRFWPPALTEWSTKAVRDAFFASPALPRLIDPDSIKQTIADAVSSKLIGYARKEGDRSILERFGEAMSEHEVEISEDIVLLKVEDAQKLLEPPRLYRLTIQLDRIDLNPNEHAGFTVKGTDQYGQPFPVDGPLWSASGCTGGQDGPVTVGETPGLYIVTARCGEIEAQAQIHVQTKKDDDKDDDDQHGKHKKDKDPTLERDRSVSEVDELLHEGRFTVCLCCRFEPSGRGRSAHRTGRAAGQGSSGKDSGCLERPESR
jgi:hypothetical protein